VEEGRVLRGGTILIKGGRIQAVGSELELPPDATLVDYGPDAVIVPGLVAAMSSYALGLPSDRTAEPSLSALDGFDSYRVYGDALAGGVTSAYITPAENRLIAGTGAVVKLAGAREAGRVLNAAAAVHGAIDASARATPGFWEPPVPVMVDVELGYARPQLPRTTMGAIVALGELMDGAARPADPAVVAEYGRRAPTDLARALAAKIPLRIAAVDAAEIRAVLAFAAERRVPLILDRADAAGELASEIAAAGVPVVYRLPYWPNAQSLDRGKGEDERWLALDVPAKLVQAGVRVAITGSSPRDLLFAARLASRGGLERAAALRAITLAPAEMLGVAQRVGSLREGKDADLCVLNGDPLEAGTSVLATWVEGALVWKAHDGKSGDESYREPRATVLEVDELHVGDGSILRPGQLLMQDGRIREVGTRVSHPRGATVVRGKSCMPGMIDAFGHLGLEGSRKVPGTDFALAALVEPGDEVDRRVAREGITTVVLTPRGASDTGAPVMAYKPAASELERQVVGDPVALRLRWEDANRLRSGQSVRALLAKAADYSAKWREYEEAIARWTPPPESVAPVVSEEAKEQKEGEKSADAKSGEGDKKDEKPTDEKTAEKKDEKTDDKKDEGDKKDSKSKKKKKGEPEPLEPDPITGLWQAELVPPAAAPAVPLRLRVKLLKSGESAALEGNLRCDAASGTLVEIEGWFDRERRYLSVSGLGSKGWIELTGELKEEKLAAKLVFAGTTLELTLARASKDYLVAKRPERAPKKEEPVQSPKGKPKAPKLDEKLEPLRRAMEGEAAIVVEVTRAIDIVPCVQAFAEVGIRPVLHGANEAHLVLDEIVGKVAGVLLSPTVVASEPKRGTDYRTPYSELQNAGIRVAFLSEAEEGAIDLPLRAAYAIANGMSPEGALRALTADAADMMVLDARIGRLASGLDADVLLLDGPPLDPATSVLRTWVNGEEVEAP
ncbi:MAG: amidohydrolase family protein, partial [Planctomycetes bacterium]|nr:amidohydrolase family protein [Planctomycetota bacterium]